MSEIKYSFIIPAFNAGKVISRCLYSICHMEYRNLEIIVINDGSKDDTGKIVTALQKKDERIQLISVENGGVSRARNIGIDKAMGEYIIFCDADDFYYSQMFGLIDETVEKYRPDMLHFGYCYDYRIKKLHHAYSFSCNKIYQGSVLEKPSFWKKVINGDDCLNVWHIVVAANIAKHIQFDLDLKYGEDTLYVLECMLQARTIMFSDVELYNYVVNTGGAIGNISQARLTVKIENILEMYQRQTELFATSGIWISEACIAARCFQMIERDLKKIYLSADNKEKAQEKIDSLARRIENRDIRNKIREWNIRQAKQSFLFQKMKFVGKNLGKKIILLR